MVWQEIISFICICLSAIVYSLSLQLKTKRNILYVQLFSTTLFLLNYLFVIKIIPSAVIGVITACFELLRLIIFYNIEKNEKYNTKKNNLIAGILFSVILSICTIFAWSGLVSILPMLGSITVSLALGSKNIIIIKLACIINTIFTFIYLLVLSLYLNAWTQVFAIVLGIVGLVKYIMQNKKLKENKKESNC